MADADIPISETESEPKEGLGKVAWGLTALVALGLAGGGFYATYSGLVAPHEVAAKDAGPANSSATLSPIFLELDPMMISVGNAGSVRQMRFRAYLQLEEGHGDVAGLKPRILDIFSTYLRAVSVNRLEDPTALLDLRAQLLRRVQLLTGPGSVSDLLIIDFVIT